MKIIHNNTTILVLPPNKGKKYVSKHGLTAIYPFDNDIHHYSVMLFGYILCIKQSKL